MFKSTTNFFYIAIKKIKMFLSSPTTIRQKILISDKKDLIQAYEENRFTLQQLSNWFFDKKKVKLSLPTLSGILKNKEKLESNFRSPGAARVRLEEHPELEKCLW